MKVQIITRIVFPVMAVMALAGCLKDSLLTEVGPAPIAFSVMSDTQSKANPVESGDFDAIKVVALGSNGYSTYFETALRKSGTSWAPEGNVTYYWPMSGNLSFISYYPTDIPAAFNSAKVTTYSTGTTAISGVILNTRAQAQSDLLFGKRTNLSQTSSVTLHMRHILSQIEIKARCLNPKIKVVVKGIKLVNIYGQARFDIQTGASLDDATVLDQSYWSNHQTDKTFYAGGESVTTEVPLVGATGATASSIMMGEGSFMLLPQIKEAWTGGATEETYQDVNKRPVKKAYIAVLCQIWQKQSSSGADYPTLLYPSASDKYGYAAVGIAPNWDPGKNTPTRWTFSREIRVELELSRRIRPILKQMEGRLWMILPHLATMYCQVRLRFL